MNNDPNTAHGSLFITGLAADPQGRFLYAATDCCGVLVYRVDASTGQLSQAGMSMPASQTSPDRFLAGITTDASGSFIYTVSIENGSVYGYSIDATTGALSLVSGSPYSAGQKFITFPLANGVGCACLASTGRLLFVAHPTTLWGADSGAKDSVYGFSIDPVTGALSPVAGSPFSTGNFPISETISPDGQYLYIANAVSSSITAYRITNSGSLQSVAGSPFLINQPLQITEDSTGLYAYVSDGNSISVFAVEQATGALHFSGEQLTTPFGYSGFSIAQPHP